MGTHPIFESDFDCLTDKMTENDELSAKDYQLGTKTQNDSVLELCACCGKPGYMKWLCYTFFCYGFAMNTLAKHMGEGKKKQFIIVFLMILALQLVNSVLRGLVFTTGDYDLIVYINIVSLVYFVFAVFMMIQMCKQRRRFVESHGVTESDCTSCCTVFWCSYCAYGQMGSTYVV